MIEIVKPHFAYNNLTKLWYLSYDGKMMSGPTVSGLWATYKRLWEV